MWFIIVTCRSVLYMLVSVAALMLLISAAATPKWLIGKEMKDTIYGNKTYRQSVGLYNRCTHINNLVMQRLEPNCGIYAKTFGKIDSIAWQACVVFLGISAVLLAVASFLTIMALCKQICGRKSVLNIAGVLQGIAGLFLTIAIVIYPVGWDTDRIQRMCLEPTDQSAPFKIGKCQLGISFYFAIGSCVGAFLGCLLSGFADNSLFNGEVQEEILEGKHLICVL